MEGQLQVICLARYHGHINRLFFIDVWKLLRYVLHIIWHEIFHLIEELFEHRDYLGMVINKNLDVNFLAAARAQVLNEFLRVTNPVANFLILLPRLK